MKKIKEFFSSPKKTAILGLIGSVIMLIAIGLGNLHYIINDLYVLGILAYFIIICSRLYKNTGNVKVANYLIIATYIISVIFYVIGFIQYISNISPALTNYSMYDNIIDYKFLLFTLFIEILQVLMMIVSLIYLCNILLHKTKLFKNNILFFIAIIYFIRAIYNFISGYGVNAITIYYIVQFIGYLLIIPYLYNYYRLLKGENKNGK